MIGSAYRIQNRRRHWQSPPPRRWSRAWRRRFLPAFYISISIACSTYLIWPHRDGLIASVTPGCAIKGNISYNTGERIYHVPGQTYYAETSIRLFRGERWFCTEAEARADGFRRAKL